MSSGNLQRVHLIPLPVSPTKMLNTLRSTIGLLSPLSHRVVDHHFLSVIIKPIPCLSPLKSMPFQFKEKDVADDSVKCLASVQVDDISCFSRVHQCCHPIIKGHHISWAWLTLACHLPCWLPPVAFLTCPTIFQGTHCLAYSSPALPALPFWKWELCFLFCNQ